MKNTVLYAFWPWPQKTPAMRITSVMNIFVPSIKGENEQIKLGESFIKTQNADAATTIGGACNY